MALKITNASGERPAVYLYGVIGDEFGGITSDQFRKELAQIPSKQAIDLHIHSDGGSFFEGVAMHSQLTQRKGDVHAIVDGLAASAASLVAMAGKTITMAKHSWMMIHEARGGMHGTEKDFRAAADRIAATNGEIVSIYSRRWKGTEAELRAALDVETWLDAEAAVAAGLADSIGESMSIAACVDDRFGYKKLPEMLAKAEFSPAFLAREQELEKLFNYSDDQPRDDHGRFDGGGGGGSSEGSSSTGAAKGVDKPLTKKQADKLTIPQTAELLHQNGYTLGKARTQLEGKTFVTHYHVTRHSDKQTKLVHSEHIKSFLMGKINDLFNP